MTDEARPVRDNPIQVGETAPEFSLKDQNIEDWTLSDHVMQSDVVLCFYPMDFSPVCSTEMECITAEMQRFTDAGATVVGISCDSFFTHKAWAEQLNLSQTLLADMHRDVCRAFGFFFPDLNVAARGTVVIGQSDDGVGTVKWVQARELGSGMDAEELLAALS